MKNKNKKEAALSQKGLERNILFKYTW